MSSAKRQNIKSELRRRNYA